MSETNSSRKGSCVAHRLSIMVSVAIGLNVVACSDQGEEPNNAMQEAVEVETNGERGERALPERWADRLMRDEPVPVVVEPSEIDLGVVGLFEVHDIAATLRNDGEESLRIAISRADCGCTAVDLAGKTIKPGETIQLAATFKASETIGERRANIHVVFEGYSQSLRIPVRAFVEVSEQDDQDA